MQKGHVGNYPHKTDNRNTRKDHEIGKNPAIQTPKRHHRYCSVVSTPSWQTRHGRDFLAVEIKTKFPYPNSQASSFFCLFLFYFYCFLFSFFFGFHYNFIFLIQLYVPVLTRFSCMLVVSFCLGSCPSIFVRYH